MVCAADLVLADIYPAQAVAEGRRVSVNYIIAGVNSKDGLQTMYELLVLFQLDQSHWI